jgi:AcrR family transcriptional regulator
VVVDGVMARGMQERGIATRAALLEAAIECLVQFGYGATTTTQIAKRAGVSRGAQLHHFPTKAELVSAAVESLFERRNAEFREAFANLEPGIDRTDAAIDLLWSMFQGPTFIAWAELSMAARTDPDLATKMIEISKRFDQQSLETWSELSGADGADPGFQRLSLAFAYSLMHGMAMESLLSYEELVPAEELIDALKFIAHIFSPTHATTEEVST